jgi:hypothetical protein
MRWLELPLP